MSEAVGYVYRQLGVPRYGAGELRQISIDVLPGFAACDIDRLRETSTVQGALEQRPAFPLRFRRADGQYPVRAFLLRHEIEQGDRRQQRLNLPASEAVARPLRFLSEDRQQHMRRRRRVSGIQNQANTPASPPKPFATGRRIVQAGYTLHPISAD